MLTLIYGPMFAGKTSRLIQLITEKPSRETIVFKPSIDTRSETKHIQSHNGAKVSCVDLHIASELLTYLDPTVGYIFIDEVQFFDSTICHAISTLMKRGKEVFASGLLYDAHQNYFGEMQTLQKMAQHHIELFSICDTCKLPAQNTFCKEEQRNIIQPGGKDLYAALCHSCYPISNTSIGNIKIKSP